MKDIYIIPDRWNISESLKLADEFSARFEYNDFFLPDVIRSNRRSDEIISFYKRQKRDRSRDILHGAFFDVIVHSEDDDIRGISEARVRRSMEIASELGIRGVVFHTNMIPNFEDSSYTEHWREVNERFWRGILKEYPDLCVFIENMFDKSPRMLAELAFSMRDEERFGVCFDYAHATAFGNDEISSWTSKLMRYTKHMHINDNDKKRDMHLSVGDGKINWRGFDAQMRESGASCSVLIEVKDVSEQRRSLEYLRESRIYPFV